MIVDPPRKPRIALMGEFSAGKSTLANLLLEQDSSPVQVTATQLPPIWYTLGTGQAERVLTSGATEPISLTDWATADPANTEMIRVGIEADLLYAVDLVDMPGTSDPCMTTDIWSRVLPLVDMVIWCTPANQAWRQSEAAMWEQVRPELWQSSLLLVTRMDKMQSELDRRRVLSRVRAEAGAMFREVLPIALPAAIAGRNDSEALEDTGAGALMRVLESALDAAGGLCDAAAFPAAPDTASAAGTTLTRKIVPRRIERRAVPRRERPQAGMA
ncbi:dynamin family protein [Salipiger aestuarii]|uniref:dynamin family protein n=1 Tax=Salipiger aestuarii TaxID=568098 RepID=UPI0016802349|nr:dynamin family protein [Salipiger aestuarii]KAA8608252.1 hypothetical protein AL037_17350 [Salipiger aestuarii]